MDQREKADKTEPALAAEPIENAEASEPTDPTDRIEPAEPMDKIEPDEPIDRIDPLDPMLRMEPEDPGERDELAEIRITTLWQAKTSRASRAECCHVATSHQEIAHRAADAGVLRVWLSCMNMRPSRPHVEISRGFLSMCGLRTSLTVRSQDMVDVSAR